MSKHKEKQDLGLRCSAWKVFGSKDFGLVGSYQKTKLDLLGQINLGLKMFVQMKILGTKIIFGSKKSLSPKNFWAEKSFLGQRHFWVQKCFWVQKYIGSKKSWV